MMVVDRRQPRDEHRATDKGSRAFLGSQQAGSIQRFTLDRKLLLGLNSLPAEITRLGKGREDVRIGCEGPRVRQKLAVEEFGIRSIRHRLELAHVDAVPLDERLDVLPAVAGLLIERDRAVIDGRRLEPLAQRTARPRLIGLRRILHELVELFPRPPVEDRHGPGARTHGVWAAWVRAWRSCRYLASSSRRLSSRSE